MYEVEKITKNSTVKKDVDKADFRPSLRLPAHLHVQCHQTLKSRRAFTMVSRFVCYNLTAKCQNAITLDVIGLFGRSKRHTKGNFEEKKNHE